MQYCVRRIDFLTHETMLIPGREYDSMEIAKAVASKMMSDDKCNGIISAYDVIPVIITSALHGDGSVPRAVKAAVKSLRALGFRNIKIHTLKKQTNKNSTQ